MLIAWRIVAPRWADTAFDGEGARLYGGRWNRPGRPAVYFADSRALAALETLIHHPGLLNLQFVRFPVEFHPSLIENVETNLSRDVIGSLVLSPVTQSIGDQWLKEKRSPILRVPSALIPEESNYLFNPEHPKADRIRIGPPETFSLDPRLL